jgi:mono/diheme cytochrome c family protein
MDRASLIGLTGYNDPSAVNIVQVVLNGSDPESASATGMPAFGADYSDAEIAAVANFVTARLGAKPSGVIARAVAQLQTTM